MHIVLVTLLRPTVETAVAQYASCYAVVRSPQNTVVLAVTVVHGLLGLPCQSERESILLYVHTEKRDGLLGTGTGGEGDERVKARPRILPEKDRRDRGPPPEQWKC